MMTRSVWGIGSALVIFWSTTCGGTAVLDGPGGDGGRSSTQSSTRSVSTTVGPSTSPVGNAVSTTGPGSCAQQPDFLSCAQCVCQIDQQGCEAYVDALSAHMYCGMTCGMACANFCVDPRNTMPESSCEMCVAGIDCPFAPPGSPQQADCDAFNATCQADITCVGFAQALTVCPE